MKFQKGDIVYFPSAKEGNSHYRENYLAEFIEDLDGTRFKGRVIKSEIIKKWIGVESDEFRYNNFELYSRPFTSSDKLIKDLELLKNKLT